MTIGLLQSKQEATAVWASHYSGAIMSALAFQITDVSMVCSTVCSGADQRKHLSSASLAFVGGELIGDRWIHPTVTRISFFIWLRHLGMQLLIERYCEVSKARCRWSKFPIALKLAPDKPSIAYSRMRGILRQDVLSDVGTCPWLLRGISSHHYERQHRLKAVGS